MSDDPHHTAEGGLPFVFLASYPKSGNTWVRMLLQTAMWGMEDERVQFDDLVPWAYQIVSPRPLPELTMRQIVMLRSAVFEHLWTVTGGNARYFVKSHHASIQVSGVPITAPLWCERAIVVVRDPRDIAASLADYMGQSVDEAIDLMGNGDASINKENGLPHFISSWSNHVRSWRQQNTPRGRQVPKHFVRYEDLHRDTAGELEAMLDFCEVEFESDEERAERIEAAVEATAFDRVQGLEDEIDFAESSPVQDNFFRKGEHAAWGDELSGEQVSRIEREHGDMMRRFGYLWPGDDVEPVRAPLPEHCNAGREAVPAE